MQRKTKIKKRPRKKEKSSIKWTQKQASRALSLGIGTLFLFNLGLGALVASSYQPTHTIVQENKGSQVGQTETDFRAVAYGDAYVDTYFNVSKSTKAQEARAKKLAVYSDGALPILAQGHQINPTKLLSKRLMAITSTQLSYAVTYESGGKKQSTLFDIAYKKEGHQFVVTAPPSFKKIDSLQGKAKDKLELNAMSSLEDAEKEKLDSYVKSLFTAYTSSENTLPLIAKDLTYNPTQSFISLDYSHYRQNADDTYTASVQATFKNAMGTHAENWTFTIKPQGSSYFASGFKPLIETNYDKKGEE